MRWGCARYLPITPEFVLAAAVLVSDDHY